MTAHPLALAAAAVLTLTALAVGGVVALLFAADRWEGR